MSDTLVYIGVQGIANRAIRPSVDLSWVWLGCVILDTPGILQRPVRFILPNIDPISLRLYAIAQATLAMSLLLCAAFALLSMRPRVVFAILGFNVFLHLLLAACEAKWANGVHLLAPISWAGWIWPESLPVYIGSGVGFAFGIYALTHRARDPMCFAVKSLAMPALVLIVAYFLLPLALMNGPLTADNHSPATLADRERRSGRLVEFDRDHLVFEDGQRWLRTWRGEQLSLPGQNELVAGSVSLRGRFRGVDSLEVSAVHHHEERIRDGASYLGLAIVLMIWVGPVVSSSAQGRQAGN